MRPAVSPQLLAAIVAAVPSRAVKKLDASPRVADGWTWTIRDDRTTVATGAETVTLAGTADVSCTCLLSPRCFHVLAVLRVLPITEGLPMVSPLLENAPVAIVSPAARCSGATTCCTGGSAVFVSPSFMPSLKPLTAPPRSEPMFFSFRVPKISTMMTRKMIR